MTDVANRKRRKFPDERVSLTEANVRKLPVPAKGKDTYYDKAVKRLALVIHASGSKSWKFIYSFRGRTRFLTLDRYEDLTVIAARKLAILRGGQVAEGRDVAAEEKARGRGSSDTFGDLTDRYLTKAKTKNKAWQQTEYVLRANVLKKWRLLPANQIKRVDVIALLEPLEDRWALHNQVRSAIMAVFAYGVEKAVVEANPVYGTKPMPGVIRDRLLSDEEVRDFYRAFDFLPQPIGTILKLMTLTGQRGNEVRNVRRQDIKGQWWEMPGKKIEEPLYWPGTKSKRNHSVWLPLEVMGLISHTASNTGAVFGPVSRQQLANAMAKVCKRLGAPKARPHDLRRTFFSTGIRLGFPQELMHRVVNHSEGKLSKAYNQHDYKPQKQRIAEAVAKKLLAIVAGTDGEDTNVVDFKTNASAG